MFKIAERSLKCSSILWILHLILNKTEKDFSAKQFDMADPDGAEEYSPRNNVPAPKYFTAHEVKIHYYYMQIPQLQCTIDEHVFGSPITEIGFR